MLRVRIPVPVPTSVFVPIPIISIPIVIAITIPFATPVALYHPIPSLFQPSAQHQTCQGPAEA